MDGITELHIREISSRMVRIYYRESSGIMALLEYLAPDFSWIGTRVGNEAHSLAETAAYFSKIVLPSCAILEENYSITEVAPGVCVCGSLIKISFSVSETVTETKRQRITFVFRQTGDRWLCVHLHASSPDRIPSAHSTQADGSNLSQTDGGEHAVESGKTNLRGIYQGVTESEALRKQAEWEMRQRERQARQALEEAYEAAIRANQAKTEFLSRMSHDIRTPMNAIMGMTAIARQKRDDQEQVDYCLEKIAQSGAQLLHLINEVLDMSKIESHNFTITETVFSIADVVNETIHLIRPTTDQQHQTFDVDIGKLEHDFVIGDSIRVQEILMNFLSNATKYTPEGGHILFSLTEKPQSSGGGICYQFVVQDNGIGMTGEFQERIFLPFERAEDSRISKVPGSGLGMAIAHNLIQMMGGSVQVESALNQGSRFTITLFFKPASKPANHVEKRPATMEISDFTDAPLTLLVEDNDLNREIARTVLEMAGLQVEEAVDGQESVERFASSPPFYYRAILMDIQMPVMDGYAATRAIRALDRPDAPKVPIIALTANTFSDDVRNAMEAGMNAHLPKPLDPDILIRTLKQWIL